jgi:hypothetical protein
MAVFINAYLSRTIYNQEPSNLVAEFLSVEASEILNSLLTDSYIAKPGENGGFLLKHGVVHKLTKSEVDVPLSYGDYDLIEAMIRYLKFY